MARRLSIVVTLAALFILGLATTVFAGVPSAVTANCSQCHGMVFGSTVVTADDPTYNGAFNLDFDISESLKATAADWDATINRMVSYHSMAGIPIPTADVPVIKDYFYCNWTVTKPSTCGAPATTTTTAPPATTTTVASTTTTAPPATTTTTAPPATTTTVASTTTTAPPAGIPTAVTANCSQCHGMAFGSTVITTDDPAYSGFMNLGSTIPEVEKAAPADWDTTVNRMVSYHATGGIPIPTADQATIKNYFYCNWTTNKPSTCGTPGTTTTTAPPATTTTLPPTTTTTAPPATTTTVAPTTTTAPSGGIPTAVTANCSQCHGMAFGSIVVTTDDPAFSGQFNLGSSIPEVAKPTTADWDSTINRMVSYHATAGIPISTVDQATIKDYFYCNWTTNRPSTCAGPAPSPTTTIASSGEAETKAYCGLCHGLVVNGVRVTSAPTGGKDRSTGLHNGTEWANIVSKMIKEQRCPIPGGVGGATYNLIVKYLTDNFGTEKIANPPGEVAAMCALCHGVVVTDRTGVKWRVTYPPSGGKDRKTGTQDKSGWSSIVSKMVKEQRCPIPGGVGGTTYNTIVNWFYQTFPK